MISAINLPSGVVSFVFTDIEGSTRLLRRLSGGYDAVLQQHRYLLRRAWDRYGGHEISTSGDSFFVAFADAGDAVRACAEAQRLLGEADWPPGSDVKVRMGVHSGLASPHGDDYVALAVHQAQRVMSAAHGGQVLVSAETAELLDAPTRAELVSLGRYRIPDFDGPVELLTLTDLPAVSRAVRAVPAEGHNFARPPGAFVGRVTDIAGVVSRLRAGSLLTLVGPGGVGKTRLAVETGLRISPEWRDGIWLVDLAPLGSPAQLPAAVADALGVVADGDQDPRENILAFLESANLLLILDNCEHRLDACTDFALSVLRGCPPVGLLATSREPLSIAGENIYRVGPLGLPKPGSPLADIEDAPAVQLLADRVAEHGHALEVSARTAPDIVSLCSRLDGLPLALELAAARLGVMTPSELVRSLDNHFDVLASREGGRPERQRSLTRLLEWSYERLSEPEQAFLRRLSVFGSSCSRQAAVAAVAGPPIDPEEGPDLLWSLADKSLVVPDLTANETRYRLLETVRAFSGMRLDATEAAAARVKLADWLLGKIGPELPRDRRWRGEVATELDNIRALVEPMAEIDCERAQLLACAVGRYHYDAHTFLQGTEELTRWLPLLREEAPARALFLARLADLHLQRGEVDRASSLLSEVQQIRGRAQALPDWIAVEVERTRGQLLLQTGELAAALRIAEETLTGALSPRGQARMWNLAGMAASSAGDLARATHAFQQELALAIQLDGVVPTAAAHGNLAELALRAGDRQRAAREQLACLRLALELGSSVLIAYSLIVSARLEASRNAGTAVGLHAKAEEILAGVGKPLYPDDRRLSDEMLQAARSELGEARFEQAVRAGSERSITEAINQATVVLERLVEGRGESPPSGG
jgi:predicted ATPase/class 3 adenylate cyclase